jgi:hypothetical protein
MTFDFDNHPDDGIGRVLALSTIHTPEVQDALDAIRAHLPPGGGIRFYPCYLSGSNPTIGHIIIDTPHGEWAATPGPVDWSVRAVLSSGRSMGYAVTLAELIDLIHAAGLKA